MNWNFTHNGFHGRREIALRVPDGSKAGDVVTLSPSQVKRLAGIVCGLTDCQCGEDGGVSEISRETYEMILPERGSEMRGNYPQGGDG